MIKKVTTLVLGAGASDPYRFPLGSDLRRNIINVLGSRDVPQRGEINDLVSLGHTLEEIADFQNALNWSGTRSVDEFLEHQTKFIEIGKAAIANQLMAAELRDNLMPQNGHWYEHIFQEMNCESSDDFVLNKLRVVTFNYDQSFEAYLHEVVPNKFRRSRGDSVRLIESIPIFHVHGTLGPLDWQAANGRSYGNHGRDRRDLLKAAAASIKIVHENVGMEEYDRARMVLKESEQIIFLGFGFHEKNVDRLFKDLRLRDDATTFATLRGIPSIKLGEISRRFLELTGKRLINPANGEDCLAFLENRVSFS